MSINEMKGVILKTDNFGETSLLIHIYSDFIGKLKVIKKGGRKQKARTSSSIQILSETEFSIYRKSGRDLHYLKEINTVHSFANLRGNPDKLTHSLFITEHILKLTPPEEPNREIYNLLFEILNNISSDYGNTDLLTLYFRIKLLKLLGTLPFLKNCNKCGKEISGIVSRYVPSEGGIICDICHSKPNTENEYNKGHSLKVRNNVLKMLYLLTRIDEDKLSTITPDNGMIEEANRFISYHINYHHETTFNTERFLKGLDGGE